MSMKHYELGNIWQQKKWKGLKRNLFNKIKLKAKKKECEKIWYKFLFLYEILNWVATMCWDGDGQWGLRSRPVLKQLIVWLGMMEI